jgi:spore cortex formation protein SpoVR/YcgB (stage V sporulation)
MHPNSQQESAISVVLEALLYGLTLEHAYDSSVLKREEAEHVLRRVFNLLTGVTANGPV